ncbi:MAG: hypothetical protein M1546_03795 [Chloroflexi bacterium]|nr:hypothetical protein [Chloroflexota bacterium]
MNERFWNLFSHDYTANCLAWRHHAGNPILPPGGSTWKKVWTANPDLLPYQGRLLLYYRGHGQLPGAADENHDRIAAARVEELSPGRLIARDLNDGLPTVDVGPAGAFDCHHVLDPAAVVFRDQVWLYYSAIGAGVDSIGLAMSAGGEHFEKVGKIMDGRAPDVLVHENRLFMLYQKLETHSRYQLYLAVSDNGLDFAPVQEKPVFVGQPGSWDVLSITTARLSRDGDWFYMLYGGSAYPADEPDYFGLARSRDLIHWERHPGNPVFGAGAKGSRDGGAIWFPALWETERAFVLLYEGSPGKYSWDLRSAICMAWMDKPLSGT